MRKLLVLMTTAAILACGATAASAQAPAAQTPGTQQSPTAQPKAEASDQDGFFRYHRGMMGRGYGHQEWCRDRAVIGPMMMRIIFSLMDADGDGTVSLQEFQAAHERIFKAMDTDHDGTVSLEEMQAFIRGH
jgi:opacity protein-like surface antigen